MSSDASWPLQKAVYDRLVTDPVLSGLITGVYDHVPQSARYPYISLGGSNVTDWSTKTFKGQDHRFELHIWSSKPGHKEIKLLQEAVKNALDDVELVLDGHDLVLLRFEFGQLLFEQSGPLYHAVNRFRALTCPHL